MNLWRRRKLLGSAAIGAVVVATAAGVLWWRGRQAAYVPGERSDGLVDTLARGLPDDRPRLEYSDVTAAAGVEFRHFPATRTNQLPEDMGSGVAAGDFDGDGWCDLYFVNVSGTLADAAGGFAGSTATARLYRNRGDGTFADVTAAAGVGLAALGHGAAFVDVDGDGDLDLFVTTYGRCHLFRNDGGGRFDDVGAAAGIAVPEGFWTGIAAGDYDRDGAVDLYVCGYVRYDPAVSSADAPPSLYARTIPAKLNPSAFRPERNLLFHNRGDGTFEEVGEKLHVQDPTGRSLGAVFVDFNADGWPDLYVANDVSDNALFVNRGDGTFRECAAEALVGDYRGAMGLAAADVDGDLDVDLFITHWVAQENALYLNVSSDLDGTEAAAPGRLLFMDEADAHGLGQIALDVVGWATGFLDFDNDGRRDLFVVNGHTIPEKDDPTRLIPQRSHLFWNGGEERGFFEVGATTSPFFRAEHVGRGGALLDWDLDGDEDLVIVRHGSTAVLLRNDGGNARPSVRLRLRQPAGNTLALGARVVAGIGGRQVVALAETQGSYLSQHAAGELSFGLGGAERIDSLAVTWPDGVTEQGGPVAADSLVTWVRGQAPRSDPLPGKHAAAAAKPATAGAPKSAAEQKRFFGLVEQAGTLRLADDFAGAAEIYRAALALHPGHEDSLYYLGNCLVELGREPEALAQFEALARVNPHSNRCFMQIGRIRLPGGDPALDDLALAEAAFARSLSINQEESGPIVALGVVALLRGDLPAADRRFADAAQLNAKSIEARYLRAFVAFRRGEREAAARFLAQAHALAEAAAHPTPAAGAAAPVVVGEGDTKKGAAMVADALHQSRSPLERWKSLAARGVDVETEFGGVELH